MEFEEYEDSVGLTNKLARLVWNCTYVVAFRPFRLPFFNFWRITLLRLFGAKIGKGCVVDARVKIWAPWNLEMGQKSSFGFDSFCYNPGKVYIGNKVVVSQRAHLCSASHNFNSIKHELIVKPIRLEDRVWVATDAFVSMGVTIHTGAIVGARACVYKDVAPWHIVGGNPAKFIKKRELDLSQLHSNSNHVINSNSTP